MVVKILRNLLFTIILFFSLLELAYRTHIYDFYHPELRV